MRFILCTWFGEFCSCCSLNALPGPAWVLLNWICKELISSLYSLAPSLATTSDCAERNKVMSNETVLSCTKEARIKLSYFSKTVPVRVMSLSYILLRSLDLWVRKCAIPASWRVHPRMATLAFPNP